MQGPNGSSDQPADPAVVPSLLYLLFGPIVWAIHLLIVYGAHTVLCAKGLGAVRMVGMNVPALVILLATTVALAVLLIALLAPYVGRYRSRVSSQTRSFLSFRDGVMRSLTVLSIVGIVWAGWVSLIVAPCLAMR